MIRSDLKTKIEAFAQRLRANNRLLEQARSGELTPRDVNTYLRSLTFLIRDALKILTLAHGPAPEVGHAQLAAFYQQEMREERGHDKLAYDDIAPPNRSIGSELPVGSRSRAILATSNYLRRATDDDPLQYLAYLLFTEYVTVLIGPHCLQSLVTPCGPSSMRMAVSNQVELDKDLALCLQEIDELAAEEKVRDRLQRVLHESMRYFDAFCGEIRNAVN